MSEGRAEDGREWTIYLFQCTGTDCNAEVRSDRFALCPHCESVLEKQRQVGTVTDSV